ncbi:MAG TPA: hypothetical protein VHB21_26940, partial [Minicystis sp.]|nr:hypothetical protein [Minicystis sp.]
EGSMTAVALPGIGTVSLVEGTAATAKDTGAGAMCRLPDGSDTHDQNTDWHLCATPTPGGANTP